MNTKKRKYIEKRLNFIKSLCEKKSDIMFIMNINLYYHLKREYTEIFQSYTINTSGDYIIPVFNNKKITFHIGKFHSHKIRKLTTFLTKIISADNIYILDRIILQLL